MLLKDVDRDKRVGAKCVISQNTSADTGMVTPLMEEYRPECTVIALIGTVDIPGNLVLVKFTEDDDSGELFGNVKSHLSITECDERLPDEELGEYLNSYGELESGWFIRANELEVIADNKPDWSEV